MCVTDRARRTASRAAAVAALALALPLAGCGDDDSGDAPTPSGGAGVPSTGVAAEPPATVAACLEKDGFTVTRERVRADVGSAVGLRETLIVVGGPKAPGVGSIEYYGTEQQAFDANRAALDAQPTGSVVGLRDRARARPRLAGAQQPLAEIRLLVG